MLHERRNPPGPGGRTRGSGLLLRALGAAALAAAASAVAAERGAVGDVDPRVARPLAARAPAAPRATSPADGAAVESVPAFSWRAVRGAAAYDFQLSADAGFRSTLASFATRNTSASIDETLFDGTYHWRVRAVNEGGTGGRWSRVRSIRKRWTTQPRLLAPAEGGDITYPTTPLVLRWSPAPHASKYEVRISADPSLAGDLVTDAGTPVETAGTSLSVPNTLSEGRYYWAVTPIDSGGLKGRRSDVGSFVWRWPSVTTAKLRDLWDDADSSGYVDPQFSWDPIPGAARYEIEVSTSREFAPGSKVCCADPTTGTSLSPTKLLPNNTDLPAAELGYHWRVRAIDLDGNAGQWNQGPSFRKVFDDVVPPVPHLTIRDNAGVEVDPGEPTSAPIVDWDPVPGASSYDVRVVPWIGGCNWAASSGVSWGAPVPVVVSGTAWTPLALHGTTPVPFSGVAAEIDKLVDGGTYCARVRARAGTDTTGKRVVSDWTTLGGASPAFTYEQPTASGVPSALTAGQYGEPAAELTVKSMPLFTWEHVPDACGYFVAVARDENFTTVVDVGRTKIPAYAPRLRTYPDETTSYYWAAMPMAMTSHGCDAVFTTPQDNSPQTFRKESSPPKLESPAAGADLSDQPTFRWSWTGSWFDRSGLPQVPAVEGAREYQLQVATDPTFASPIDNVKTASTAYTSSSTYPADTAIYWRVRANDENGTGLRWSDTQVFRRRLRIPSPSSANPTRGESFPVFVWSSVPGVVSYDFHVEEEDGDKRDFTFGSTAASFIRLYGLGVFRWQVRANFPKLPFGTVRSGWSPVQTFTRFIEPPRDVGLAGGSGRVLLSWAPSSAAHKYRVEFSESNSFTRLLEAHVTRNTNYAPRLTQPGFANGGVLHWRVAALDEGNHLGGWTTGVVRLPRGLRVTVLGLLSKRKRGKVTVLVADAKARPVRRARVKARGAGVRSRPRRTGRLGTVSFALRPRRRGTVTFTVRKRGYRAASVRAPVR